MHPLKSTLLLLAAMASSPAVAAEFMFSAVFNGSRIEGQPLEWSDSEMLLLGRDGQLHVVDPRVAQDGRRTASSFSGFSVRELRSQLYEEFGTGVSVASTGHYLVVHRSGDGGAWAQRFEDLYRSFARYFRVRGFELAEPPYPLVAVIFASRDEYYRYAESQGTRLQPDMLGHYDPRSNRVLMYHRPTGSDDDWGSTATTIIHEATHQTAFNVGLHSRGAETPKWLVEGLATMFEVPGVYQGAAQSDRRDRVHQMRLADFRSHHNGRPTGTLLPSILASDARFRQDAVRAYAEAWALSFYLSETRPRQYEQYLQLTAARPALTSYEPADRVRDFQRFFGSDLALLEANFLKWVEDLP